MALTLYFSIRNVSTSTLVSYPPHLEMKYFCILKRAKQISPYFHFHFIYPFTKNWLSNPVKICTSISVLKRLPQPIKHIQLAYSLSKWRMFVKCLAISMSFPSTTCKTINFSISFYSRCITEYFVASFTRALVIPTVLVLHSNMCVQCI